MPKYVPIEEFRDFGFIQEINRTFLHPMGMALEVIKDADGAMRLGGIWDHRDDPEGMIFSESIINNPAYKEKSWRVADYWMEKCVARLQKLGYIIQEVEGQ